MITSLGCALQCIVQCCSLGRRLGFSTSLHLFSSHPPTPSLISFMASTAVGREAMSWWFIRLHAIGPSPWKVDGSLTIDIKIVLFSHPHVHCRSRLLSLQLHENITLLHSTSSAKNILGCTSNYSFPGCLASASSPHCL